MSNYFAQVQSHIDNLNKVLEFGPISLHNTIDSRILKLCHGRTELSISRKPIRNLQGNWGFYAPGLVAECFILADPDQGTSQLCSLLAIVDRQQHVHAAAVLKHLFSEHQTEHQKEPRTEES
jgi:hypothetical protein